ncbi:hypothetical protein EZ428_10720 [Pedobacter frigiditerrae]|uniref:Uncharacterized protein n=1 Tax=Pedobacter frigiditerrae TaxID=2530452 RepID=A0A4R0MZ37_9SPHI|nr:hypothetical protein [Pedobacter frigiditerrae]TCC92193.1 hypothetical protein EZ428_10720 [Pedobacter frigiditerrae]
MNQDKKTTTASKKVPSYYTYCVTEGKRIGSYSGDKKVIDNRTNHHIADKGHEAETREQDDNS